MRFVAYYRVSTAKQGNSGLGLDAQRQAVQHHIGNSQLLAEYTEVESGANNSRPQLQAALDYAELTGSTLIVAKLDRLSRDAEFLNKLLNGTVPIRFADMPFADRFIIGVMAQVAQWERDRISTRTKEALQQAKARGKSLGGNRGNLPAVSAVGAARSIQVRKAKSNARRDKVMPHIAQARAAGCNTLSSIAAWLNAMHIAAPRGGQWQAAQVARLIP